MNNPKSALSFTKLNQLNLSSPISYATKIKEGRGEGVGENYRPWYQVGEKISHSSFKGQKSRGNGHRIKGLKHNRVHHLLSSNEKLLFMTFDLNPDIADIREQFPLNIDVTKKIALELGIKYPDHVENHVLTSDFVLDYKNEEREAITFKPLSNFSPRQLELFQIERTYWLRQGVKWHIMTDKDIPANGVYNKNILDVYYSVSAFHNDDFQTDQIKDFYRFFESSQGMKQDMGILDFCEHADLYLDFEVGTCLRILKVFQGKRLVDMDLNLNVFSNEHCLKTINLKYVKNIDQSILAA